MSKNKNPLKDLDQFLKQQATSFITPPSLSDKVPHIEPTESKSSQSSEITDEQLIAQLERLAKNDRNAFYDLLIQIGEKLQNADEKMIINTALYLKGGDKWKDLVREYWGKKVNR